MVFFGSVRDKNGLPLCGIPVSDGRNIALTDSDGKFFLDGFERTKTVFLCLLTRGLNDWYRMADGEGESFEFTVDPVEIQGDFCFLHTSDTEIENRADVSWVPFMSEKVREHSPAFFVHTGDLCRAAGVEKHRFFMNPDTLGCPVRYVIGNHDFVGESYGEERFEELYAPSYYSFDVGDVHFVALSIGKGDRPSGYLPEDQYLWLENDLRINGAGKRLVILDHELCKSDEKGFGIPVGDRVIDLRRHGLLGWVFGHYHCSYVHEYDGVLNICTALPDSGGIDSSAGGIRKISVNSEGLETEMLYHCPPANAPEGCVWSAQLEGHIEYSQPILTEKGLVAATCDDGYPKKCGIYLIDGESGGITWKYPTKDGIKGKMAYLGGRLFAEDTRGRLYCLDAESGCLLWQTQTFIGRPNYTRSGVILADGLVIAGSPACVSAYRPEDGTLVWHSEPLYSEGTPAEYVYDKKRGQLLISAHWNGLYALDVKTGRLLWKNFGKMPLWYRTATPCVGGDVIYAVGGRTVTAVDPSTGEITRQKDVGCDTAVSGAPVILGDTLYLPTATGGVLALDKYSFEELGRISTDPACLFTPPYAYGNIQTVEGSPVMLGDCILFAGSDGYIRLFDRERGEERTRIFIGSPTLVSPIPCGDSVYTADFSGRIAKFIL